MVTIQSSASASPGLASSGVVIESTRRSAPGVPTSKGPHDATLFASLSAIVPSRWRPDLRPLRLAAGREAMQLALQAGNPEWAIGHLTGWHVGDLMEAGDTEGAARTAQFGADAAAIHRQPYVRAVLGNCRAMMALHAGRLLTFELGAHRLAVSPAREADRASVVQRWGDYAGLDLLEPFARIREAIEEAQKASR